MTRGGGGADEEIEGGAPKIFRHPKGGSEKIRGDYENLYTLKPIGVGGGGGAPKNLAASEGGEGY